MKPATRTEQIKLRTLIMDCGSIIRYREAIRYAGIITSKKNRTYHKFNDIDLNNDYFIDSENRVFTKLNRQIVPIEFFLQWCKEQLEKNNNQ